MIAYLGSTLVAAGVLLGTFSPVKINSERPVTHAEVDSFTYYLTPGQCKMGVLRAESFYYRDKRRDSVLYEPLRYTVPDIAQRFGRECGAQFDVETIATRDLYESLDLFLLTGEGEKASRVISRIHSSYADSSRFIYGNALLKIVRMALSRGPASLPVAISTAEEIERLGVEARMWSASAYSALSDFYFTLNQLDSAISMGAKAVQEYRGVDSSERLDRFLTILNIYKSYALPYAIKHGSEAAQPILDSLADELTVIARPRNALHELERMLYSVQSNLSYIGKSSAPLEADDWFNAEPGRVYPKEKTVSIIYFASGGCSESCLRSIATLKRLMEEFKPQGLEVVLVASTNGHLMNQVISDVKKEASMIRDLIVEYQGLSEPLGVVHTDFIKSPDRRRFNAPQGNEKYYGNTYGHVLVDKEGKIALKLTLTPEHEEVWRGVITSALGAE